MRKQAQSSIEHNRELVITEEAGQTVNALEQALRVQDYRVVQQLLDDENFGLFEQLGRSLKQMLVQYILNNVSVSGIKLLCKYKADPSIQQMKDEIYIKLIDLELNKPLVD